MRRMEVESWTQKGYLEKGGECLSQKIKPQVQELETLHSEQKFTDPMMNLCTLRL